MYKRIFPWLAAALLSLLLVAGGCGTANAASTITATQQSLSVDQRSLVIKLACTAHTDGTFTSVALTGENLSVGLSDPRGRPRQYWQMGFYLYEVYAVNPAATYPTTAAVVTLADDLGTYVMQSGEMALSTSASGVAYAVLAKYRAVKTPMTISIADTGAAANTLTIYIVLAR